MRHFPDEEGRGEKVLCLFFFWSVLLFPRETAFLACVCFFELNVVIEENAVSIAELVDTDQDEVNHPEDDGGEDQATCNENEEPPEHVAVRPERAHDEDRHNEDRYEQDQFERRPSPEPHVKPVRSDTANHSGQDNSFRLAQHLVRAAFVCPTRATDARQVPLQAQTVGSVAVVVRFAS